MNRTGMGGWLGCLSGLHRLQAHNLQKVPGTVAHKRELPLTLISLLLAAAVASSHTGQLICIDIHSIIFSISCQKPRQSGASAPWIPRKVQILQSPPQPRRVLGDLLPNLRALTALGTLLNLSVRATPPTATLVTITTTTHSLLPHKLHKPSFFNPTLPPLTRPNLSRLPGHLSCVDTVVVPHTSPVVTSRNSARRCWASTTIGTRKEVALQPPA